MTEKIYFGTYTKDQSKGIYQAELNLTSEQLSTPSLAISTGNPTYLCLTDHHSLVTIANEGQLGGIETYDLTGNSYSLLDEQFTKGSSPCYVSFDSKRQLIFTSYYHRGTVEVYHLNSDATLTLTDRIAHQGKGPRPEQDGPHVHYADLTSDGRLAVVDLGNDTLTTYDISDQGKLKLVATLKFDEGFGPRHLVFANHDHTVAYLAAELSSHVAVLKYDPAIGQFEIQQVLSTIPNDFTSHNGVAAIRITNDDRFVYVSNRGHDSLAIYKVNDDHSLELVDWESTQGSFPRDFALNKSNEFLLVANQTTNNATLFKRNSNNGKLKCIQQNIPLPESVCVCFVD